MSGHRVGRLLDSELLGRDIQMPLHPTKREHRQRRDRDHDGGGESRPRQRRRFHIGLGERVKGLTQEGEQGPGRQGGGEHQKKRQLRNRAAVDVPGRSRHARVEQGIGRGEHDAADAGQDRGHDRCQALALVPATEEGSRQQPPEGDPGEHDGDHDHEGGVGIEEEQAQETEPEHLGAEQRRSCKTAGQQHQPDLPGVTLRSIRQRGAGRGCGYGCGGCGSGSKTGAPEPQGFEE